MIKMNDQNAGSLKIEGQSGTVSTVSGGIRMPAGKYELKLIFEASDNLEIMEIVLK